jgi:hypothetical protein
MGDVKTFPTREKKECLFCHDSFPCHGKGYTETCCPRVEAISWLPGSEVHHDGWYIEGVKFRDYILEVEVEDEE